jgi:hypothetical protein
MNTGGRVVIELFDKEDPHPVSLRKPSPGLGQSWKEEQPIWCSIQCCRRSQTLNLCVQNLLRSAGHNVESVMGQLWDKPCPISSTAQPSNVTVLRGTGNKRRRQRKRVDLAAAVLEVFPDADFAYVTSILKKSRNAVDIVVEQMAEKPYPKTSLELPLASSSVLGVLVEMETRKWQFDFMSTESFQATTRYKVEAEQQISFDCK